MNEPPRAGEKMYQTFLSLGASIQLVEPQPPWPDMVFTANSAIVLDGKVLLSHFRHPERQGEEKHFREFFENLKPSGILHEVHELPKDIVQEGAGDCAWDSSRGMFWAGYGPRSSQEATQYIGEFFGKQVLGLELASDEFYHIDVSLCPLSKGDVMYYPNAFTKGSQAKVLERVAKEQLITVGVEDASSFAVNAVNLNNTIVMSSCSEKLGSQLKERGYSVINVPVETFGLSGGSVLCMTLRLDFRSS